MSALVDSNGIPTDKTARLLARSFFKDQVDAPLSFQSVPATAQEA